MNPLTVTARVVSSGPVVQVAGDLDYDSAHRLRDQLAALELRPGQRLVVDLAALGLCDSSGIGALLFARNRASSARAEIVLVAVSDQLWRTLHRLGLDQVFACAPDAAEGHQKGSGAGWSSAARGFAAGG
ncbi:STAS domain-containing protein [Streptomyces flavofungini]|uniref:STAS domain-containing protein n=1 Tax=Streptomyces flavofungini TaxID=68200 RepID=UPI0034DECC30